MSTERTLLTDPYAPPSYLTDLTNGGSVQKAKQSWLTEMAGGMIPGIRARGLTLSTSLEMGTVVLVLPDDLRERLDRLEAEVVALREALATRPVTSHTMLRDLNSEGYALKEPISIVLEEYAEEVIARWPEVEVWASAETQSEAISRLKKRILERYEDVMDMEIAQMGRLPQSWKRILMGVIQPNGQTEL